MNVIDRYCPTGPMKSVECLAFFGVEYQTYLTLIIISLIIGFGSYFIYSKIRGIKLETKRFIIRSLIISLVVFILLTILTIWQQSQIVY